MTLPPSPTALEQLRDRTSPLCLLRKLLKNVVLHIGLHAHFQLDVVPVGIPLLALDQHRSRKIALDGHIPLPQLDTQVPRDQRASHLRAGSQAGQREGQRSRGGVVSAEGRVSIDTDPVRAPVHGDRLGDAGALAVNAERHILRNDGGSGE